MTKSVLDGVISVILTHLTKNPQRTTTKDREFIRELYYSGISFPVTIKQY